MQTSLKGKRILIAPLNWGLGHATRCVPIIEQLLQLEAEIVLAGDGAPLQFLKELYPQLTSYELPSYNIQYPAGWGGAWKTVFQASRIIQTIRKEQKVVEDIVQSASIDILLSDHRYGVYSPQVTSIFIAHQLKVLPPKGLRWGAEVILAWHKTFLKHFNEIWVPDYEGENNLSGILSHDVKTGVKTRFIGPQSRFSLSKERISSTEEKIVALISGPEPQRSFFEQLLLNQLQTMNQPAILIRGVVTHEENHKIGKVDIVHYLHGEELKKVLSTAKLIISRPGYSTLMDLSFLNKKSLFIPTPGQTEQEYLAENLAKKNCAIVQKQSKLDISKALDQLDYIQPIPSINTDEKLLKEALLCL